MAGEIRVRGVLVYPEDHSQKWLLRLEKPIEIDGKEINVAKVIVSSTGRAFNGRRPL